MASDELRTILSPLLSREERAIWITKSSYACLRDVDRTIDDHVHESQFCFDLTDTDKHVYDLVIHASTLEESIICLDYLVGLKDTQFEKMELVYKEYSVRICPFGANILEKMLQNFTRRISFKFIVFTPDHCRTLASSGTKTSIEFFCCDFQDEGTAFVEASVARLDETSGPANLRFFASNPFNDRNWALFLSQHKLKSLKLDMVELESEVSCRAVATAQVQLLELDDCELVDGGAALIESVRQGRGPKELCFHGNSFDSLEQLVTFIYALRGNTCHTRLELPNIHDRQEMRALAAALRENKGLVYLKVKYFGEFDESDITELLQSVSLHPSLRSLDLFHPSSHAQEKCDSTKAVADMLSVNERVELMNFDDNTFDEEEWNTNVVPRLECNLYRKRCLLIHKIEDASTRAAVLARALTKFASKPHLVWMLLNQNHDIVSSFLDSTTLDNQSSIPSRKRSRSPSLDRMSGGH
jgi:hypothetical protein